MSCDKAYDKENHTLFIIAIEYYVPTMLLFPCVKRLTR